MQGVSKDLLITPASPPYRIEELEASIASAIGVNKLLNKEVEAYIAAADRWAILSRPEKSE